MVSFSAHVRLAILLTLLASPSVQACINLYYTDLEGHSHQSGGGLGLSGSEVNIPHWQKLHDELEQELQVEDDFKKRSNLAAALMHLGKAEQAVEILIELEANHPDEYTIAGNLGTAYELVGDLDNAIHWIKVAIERNPKSHRGTEWLHVRILEVKQELTNDPDWLQAHSVLGLEFGRSEKPGMPTDFGQGKNFEKTIHAIKHQLYERLQFIEAPDPIVANLLITLGNLVALDGYVESAIEAYRMAIEFEPQSDRDLIQTRLSHFEEIVKSNPQSGKDDRVKKETLVVMAMITVCCVIAFFIAIPVAIVWWVRRRRAKRKVESLTQSKPITGSSP